MKILITNSSPIWGGNENWTVTAGRLLQERGHAVGMILLKDSPVVERARQADLPVITVERFGGDLEPSSLLRLYRIFRDEGPDAVILTKTKDYWVCGLTAWRAGVSRRFLRFSIVRRVKDNRKYRLVYGTFVQGAIVNSREVEQAIRSSAEWTAALNIHVLYNGIADPRSRRDPKELEETARALRRRWNIPPDAFVFGACVNITQRKRLDLIVAGLADLQDRLPRAHAVIAGDGAAREELMAQARELKVEDRIHFPGYLADTGPLYHLFDLYVISSQQESMTYVGMEAMAHRCPVLATDCGGIAELLDGGRCGLIVAVDDPKALRDGMLRLAADDELRARFARRGRERFETHFTEGKMAANLEAILENRPQPYPPDTISASS
jgi:glycosyltransferase involved in cell wall biosynthesis